jgi:hypothetical protein
MSERHEVAYELLSCFEEDWWGRRLTGFFSSFAVVLGISHLLSGCHSRQARIPHALDSTFVRQSAFFLQLNKEWVRSFREDLTGTRREAKDVEKKPLGAYLAPLNSRLSGI